MAYDELEDGTGQDIFDDMYNKYNETMVALKAGNVGQVLLGVTPGGEPVWGAPPVVGIKFLPPIDIGNWNMDSTDRVSVAHGLSGADWKKIRSIDVIIRNDADDKRLTLVKSYVSSSANVGGSVEDYDDTYINLLRTTGGEFDTTDFNTSPYNRGFITIGVIE